MLTLGDTDGPGSLATVEAFALRTRGGDYVVRGMYSPSLAVFDSSGRYRRTVGREGGAPGEYRGIASIANYRGDSLLVLDWGNSRFSVLDPSFSYVRGGALPFTPALKTVSLGDGSFVHARHAQTPDRVGQPLQRLSPRGEWLSSFGSADGIYRPDIPLLLSRTLATADAGRIWSAAVTAYEISRIDVASGRVVQRLFRDVPWFPDWRRPGVVGSEPDRPPRPLLVAMREDAEGLLWVLVAVPDARWRTQVRRGQGAHGHAVADEQEYYDTIIEVIDPRRGELLASRRVGEYIRQFVDDALVGTVVEDLRDGVPRLRVWRVELMGDSNKRQDQGSDT